MPFFRHNPGMMDPEPITKRIEQEARRRILAAAQALADAYRKDVSVPNPTPHTSPAKRGEFPRLRTGRGREAIEVVIGAAGEISVEVDASGQHLGILAARGWKGLADSLARRRFEITQILRGADQL